MISDDDLIALVRNYNPKTNEALIRAAYKFGGEMHDGQLRHSGEPYFTHPVAVAAILTEQQLDDATIITALLHDTIEDTKASYKSVADTFGDEIAKLVDGVTKLTNLQLSSVETKQAENFRKLFMAMSKDMRVILVKLADRLHNMRTIRSMRADKQLQKARETMDIFAPLAGRMGMQWMREELEDLAFKVLNPEARSSIIRRFITMQRETGDVIQRITGDMRRELEKAGIEAEVFGRAKKPYSIWRKMQEKDQSFSRLSDIYGVRVITGTEEDCYRTLGAIHQRWRAVPGRFKDYISQPKTNGYRSIHTTVSGRDGKRVEVQIRTGQMHDVAETGVAAHWSYRDGVRGKNPFAVDPAKWIAQLTEQFDGEDDHEDFLEAVKLEMYSDQVFCFTPKGEVVKLPRGATPIDFAYAIHTRIGNACVGAKVDGMRVPLWTRIKNGQSVEIITAEGQTPQTTWLEIATTGKAKVIKSHHNVGGLPDDMNLDLIEPLRELFKDEVRRIGVELGLPAELVMRHPFPGPGLGVRILGEVQPEFVEPLQKADHIFISELRAAGLYDKVSQAFAVFLPVKSVGVVGDARRYEYVIALRAVETIDFMTARWAYLDHEFLDHVSRRIITECHGVSRVVYDISGKPPATIEWE